VTKKSIAVYLIAIGLLLIVTTGWYMYAFLSQPSPAPLPDVRIDATPDNPEPVIDSTDIQPSETPHPTPTTAPASFDGLRAYGDVLTQVAFGARTPGSEGHAKIQKWMRDELVEAGWQVEVQASEASGHRIENIIAKRKDEHPRIIIGAHYDSRMFADNDPDPSLRTTAVAGANDGASGVAVLLELARTLPPDSADVWLVFFDAEDNGNIEGWDWILGSREFVQNNPFRPRAVVIVDMIGDADLNIYKEINSNPALTNEIWETAKSLGYENKFIPEFKHSMIDDHKPFLEAGIPAIDIIDFDYPYWHTTQDTPDKVSAESLEIVGRTLWTWVTQQSRQP
jgi:Iap family predicted aminopeptidase